MTNTGPGAVEFEYIYSAVFQHLKISGFKSLESVEISLAPLTVLLGENSIGKSSIIQALLLVAENLKSKNGSKFQLNGQAVRLGNLGQVATVGSRLPMTIAVELAPNRKGDSVRKFAVQLETQKNSSDSETEMAGLSIATGSSSIELKKLKGKTGFGISGKIVGRGNHRAEVEFPKKATVQIGAGRKTADFSSGLSDVPWEDFDEWASARLDVRVPTKSSDAIIEIMVRNFLTLDRVMNDPTDVETKQSIINDLKLEYLPLTDTLDELWAELPNDLEMTEKYVKFIGEVEEKYFTPNFAFYRKALDIPKGSFFISPEDLTNLEELVSQFLLKWGIPEKGIWSEKIETGEAFEDYQVELVHLYYDIANSVKYVGPIRQAGTELQRNDLAPSDIAPVGVSGELTGLILARSLGTKSNLQFPLPPGIEESCFNLISATERWCQFFGIGNRVEIRNLGLAGLEVLLDGKPLHALGTGVSQLLPVIVLCLTSSTRSLIVLEQPELHLHPSAQQKLADFFLQIVNSGRQMIVETHSEYLVTRLRRAVVVSKQHPATVALQFISRNSLGKVEIQRSDIDADGMVAFWPKGFFQQTDDDLLAILEASLGDE